MAQGPAEIVHGPILIGTALNVFLYGITITQLYLYHAGSGRRDRALIKTFVYFLFFGDTVHTIFTLVYVYDTLVLHFGDVSYLTTGNWIFATDPGLTGILGSLVQSFYAWRVKVLTDNVALVVAILICSASSFLMGIATSIAIGLVPRFLEFQRFKVVVIIWLVSASFADLVITSTLVIYLRRHKTGFIGTDSHIDRIIRLTIQTGLLTAVWAFVDLMVYLLDPTGTSDYVSYINYPFASDYGIPARHLIFNFPLSKLYTNSLLSSLNARNNCQWCYGENSTETPPNLNTLGSGWYGQRSNPLQFNTEVFVHVESHEMVDSLERLKPVQGSNRRHTKTGSDDFKPTVYS